MAKKTKATRVKLNKKSAKRKPVKKAATKKLKPIPVLSKYYNIKDAVEVQKMIAQFKKFVNDNKCFVNYEGKPYVTSQGWQFAGSLLGFRVKIGRVTKEIAPIGELLYKAEGSLQDMVGNCFVDGIVMFCSSTEGYTTHASCASMAQTRVMSKCYRMLLGWIVQAAGFEVTPAEEIGQVKPGIADMKKKDFEEMFSHCKTLADVLQVINANKKLQNNADFREAMTDAGAKCKLNDTEN